MTLDDLKSDKEFMSASPQDQTAYLSHVDPDFKAASPEDQKAFLQHVSTPYAPPAAGPHVVMEEENILSPSDAGAPSRGVAPAGKLTHLPGVNPHVPTFKEGESDVMLAGAPLIATMSPTQVVGGLAGGAAGAKLGRMGAEKVGLGITGQELSESAGGIAGSTVGGIVTPKVAPPLIRGAGKAYNVGLKVGEKVAPIAGVIEGVNQALHGNLQGAAYSAAGGGLIARTVERLPQAPKAITEYGLPKIGQKPAGLGRIGEPAPEPLIRPRAKATAGASHPEPATVEPASPKQWLQDNPSASPDHAEVEAHVMDLGKEDFHTLAKARGVPADAYDVREAMREGGTKHSTGRQQIARQMVADMSGEELENIQRTAQDIKNNPDQSSLSKAERSRLLFKELKPAEEPLIRGGAKIKAPSDLSPLTMKLVKSLGINPQRVLDEFEGTEQALRSRLLKASAADLKRWK